MATRYWEPLEKLSRTESELEQQIAWSWPVAVRGWAPVKFCHLYAGVTGYGVRLAVPLDRATAEAVRCFAEYLKSLRFPLPQGLTGQAAADTITWEIDYEKEVLEVRFIIDDPRLPEPARGGENML